MTMPVITQRLRKMNYKFMLAEAAWVMSGSDRIHDLGEFARLWKPYSDDGIHTFGAYGPKVVSQIDYVANKLTYDHDSRQAVINIWRENPPTTKDVPCTLSMQFLIVGSDWLDVVVTMRSSDLWLGYVYDIFVFSMIAWGVASKIQCRPVPRDLHILVGNQHLYEHDVDNVIACLEEPADFLEVPDNLGLKMSQVKSWGHLKDALRNEPDTPGIPLIDRLREL